MNFIKSYIYKFWNVFLGSRFEKLLLWIFLRERIFLLLLVLFVEDILILKEKESLEK